MIWCDIDVCDWLNKCYGFSLFSFSMTLAVDKMDVRGLSNTARCEHLAIRLGNVVLATEGTLKDRMFQLYW